MDGSCYYSVLGLLKNASFSEIRSAYRKLALEWHPDKWIRNPSQAKEANRKFQKIQEAYSVLSDPNKKSMYDAGALDYFDDIDDDDDIDKQGMGDFLNDLMKIMDQNTGTQVETIEDLQKTFEEMFGDDLREFMEKQDQTDRKRARHVSMDQNNMMPKSSRACR